MANGLTGWNQSMERLASSKYLELFLQSDITCGHLRKIWEEREGELLIETLSVCLLSAFIEVIYIVFELFQLKTLVGNVVLMTTKLQISEISLLG